MRKTYTLKSYHWGCVIAFVVGIVATPSYGSDPCSFLNRIEAQLETKEGLLGTIGKIYQQIHNLVSSPYFQDLEENEKTIYFTRQPGFYFTLDCSIVGSNKRIERIGMFGVGDIFKPLRKRMFSGEIYYYGLRRSGLISFVRKKDLRKMKEDEVYFFNKTVTPTHFCTNNNYCSGIHKEFNARHHYAVMPSADFKAKVKSNECVDFDVAIFNGKKPKNTSRGVRPEYKHAQLKYCHKSYENGVFSDYSKKASDELDKLPITGQYLLLSHKVLTDKIPFLFTKKNCQIKKSIKKNSFISLGGSIGAGLDFKLVKSEADGTVKVSYDITDEEVFDPDKQYLYQSYSATLHGQDGDKKELLNDIVVTQTCEEASVPTKLNEIRINVSPKEGKLIVLDVKELDHFARRKISGVWNFATSSSRIKGRTWLIASVEQKMQWKEFLFGRIYRDIRSVVPLDVESFVLVDYADYFTDLFMATAFEYIPENKVVDIQIIRRF